MNSLKNEKAKKEYEQYVNEITPKHSLPLQMGKAFLVGGVICTLGQVILHLCETMFHMKPETAGSWGSLILVALSLLLTWLNIYQLIVKFAGAGALVPITGLAYSVAAPAIEYQKEGQVMGIGCKIFTIAGPVILYGIFCSWLLGLIYWISTFF